MIIPCFNESLSIIQTVQEVRTVNPSAVIVVVDNGSTDDTARKATSIEATVLIEPRPGKGYAFRRGLSALHPGITSVLMVDGDATYGMESLEEACKLVSEHSYDMVIGVRQRSEELAQSRSVHYRRGHTIGNEFLSWIFRRLFKLKLSDPLSGWRVFSPAFLYSFPGGSSGFELETELNAHAKSINALVAERPISYHGRVEGSVSKLSTFKDGRKILRRNIQLVKDERPLIAFGVLALPWLIISTSLFVIVFIDYVNTGLVPRFPSLIAAVGSIAIAAQLWVTGMILERVRLNRNIMLQINYRAWVLNQK